MGDPAGPVAYLEQAIRDLGVLRAGERLLLAVSGGQDSTALALAMAVLSAELDLRCEVAHVNHGIRGGAADADETFVRELSADLGLPYHARRVDAPARSEHSGCGLEEAARLERHAALRDVMARAGLDRIAMGHTATDRAETILMNILRGCGLDGLAAMRAEAGHLVRPLLGVGREDTRAYCVACGVEPRDDATNADESILRNRVRLSLLPLLEREYRPGAARSLNRLAEIVETEVDWTAPLALDAAQAVLAEEGDGSLRVDLAAALELPTGLRRRVLRSALERVRGDLRDISLDHLASLERLVTSGATGNRLELPGVWGERTAQHVVLRSRPREERSGFRASLSVPGVATVAEAGLELTSRIVPAGDCDPGRRGSLCAQLDAKLVGPEVVVRSPEPGDRIAPLGMQGTKKLQDIFVDGKTPRSERERTPVVTLPQGEVIWVVGHCISERVKVTPETERVVELVARPLG